MEGKGEGGPRIKKGERRGLKRKGKSCAGETEESGYEDGDAGKIEVQKGNGGGVNHRHLGGFKIRN